MSHRLLWVLLAGLLAGCASGWRIEATGAAAMEHLPERVRVTKQDGTRVELRAATMEGDSLVGLAMPDSSRVALPVEEIARIAVRGPTAATESANLTGGVIAGMAMIFFVLFAKGGM